MKTYISIAVLVLAVSPPAYAATLSAAQISQIRVAAVNNSTGAVLPPESSEQAGHRNYLKPFFAVQQTSGAGSVQKYGRGNTILVPGLDSEPSSIDPKQDGTIKLPVQTDALKFPEEFLSDY